MIICMDIKISTHYDRRATDNGSETAVKILKNRSESSAEDGTKERQCRYGLMTREVDMRTLRGWQ